MSNISLTNGATYTFNSNGEIISNEGKCVSFKYFSETESGQPVTLTLNTHIDHDIYGYDAYLSPYSGANEEEFNNFIAAGGGESIYSGTIQFNMGRYEYVIFRFHNPVNYEDTGYDIMVNGTLYESVLFSVGDNLHKYAELYINNNLVGSDEIVIDIYQLVKHKQVQITYSNHYVNIIPDVYLTDEEGNYGGTINADNSGEYDLRRYNVLHICGDVQDSQHYVKISVEPRLAYETVDLSLWGSNEIDAEINLKDLVYPGKNDTYYNNIDYVTIHFKMNWE